MAESEKKEGDVSDDVKITMEPKILQQILGKLPEAGNQINVITIGNIMNGSFNLESYIESLPQPRLKNLMKEAIAIAMKKYKSHEESGAWLGGSRRLINYRLEDL
jgi:hypothetical protein